MRNSQSLKSKSLGFTIVELLIVLAITALLAVIGIPYARGIIISGKVEPTASDITKVVTKLRGNFTGQGTTPYTNLGATGPATAVFANTARGLASSLTVAGAGSTATATHDIGATGSAITVAQDNIGGTTGDSFSVTLVTVNDAACPGLASQVQKSAEQISINGTVVKAVGAQFNGGAAQNACTADDTNTFVFSFR